MSNEIAQLGRIIKPLPPQIGATTGTIISASPLRVRISDKITAQYPNLYYAAGLIFEVGDRVIVIASTDNQRFYIVGKAVKA